MENQRENENPAKAGRTRTITKNNNKNNKGLESKNQTIYVLNTYEDWEKLFDFATIARVTAWSNGMST
jgi:hypothetical protein